MTVRLNDGRILSEDEVREVVIPQKEVTRTVTHTTVPAEPIRDDPYGRSSAPSSNLRRKEPVRTTPPTTTRAHTVTVTKEVNRKTVEIYPVDPTRNPAYLDMLDFAKDLQSYFAQF